MGALRCGGNGMRGGGRAVPEPPLRVVRKVGFDGIVAVNFRGDDMIGGGLRRGFGIWRLGG